MDFVHASEPSIKYEVELPPRSLVVMEDESRYLFLHSIASRKYDFLLRNQSDTTACTRVRVRRGNRISLTFRYAKPRQYCDCRWKQTCDMAVTSSCSLDGDNAMAVPDSAR